MQPLDDTIKAGRDDMDGASLVIETILLGMRAIRVQMRHVRPSNLSVAQFRVLAYLSRHQAASLSEVADHIGLTLPSMSKAVDHLVRQGLVERSTAEDDRRRVELSLSSEGRRAFRSASESARKHIARLLADLSPDEQSDVARGMTVLSSVLSPGQRG
jgi:DNA-binding MarR family transcriptional regulator